MATLDTILGIPVRRIWLQVNYINADKSRLQFFLAPSVGQRAGLSLLASGIFASLDNGARALSSPVYILKTTEPATLALGRALDTLGYTRQGTKPNQENQKAPSNAYIEVTSDAQLSEIGRSYPDAKFIIPQGSRLPQRRADDLSGIGIGIGPALWGRGAGAAAERDSSSSSPHDWANHTLLEEKRLQGLLELDVLALEAGAQAENWVALCEFLGMGYSVVERLGLWHFPH
ncbi:hypothetical protein K449DRAFT_461830 [Hypoxylon sp. EC38]|nr:hypothetical protein K449DRAFT_461830 [Hypoxylon sp. EC38]